MPWRLISYQIRDAFENMAVDEAIFRETMRTKAPPTLRFYGWHPRAVSLGYFQDIDDEVNLDYCRLTGVDVVRRLTGGKAVYHSDEVTYSLAASDTEKLFPSSITATYEIISRCIACALALLGIDAHLAEATVRSERKIQELASCCFSIPSGNELLVDSRKICGSAQTRVKGGFLQHGALLLSFDAQETGSLILSRPSESQIDQIRRSVAAINELLASPVTPIRLCHMLQKGFEQELGIELVSGELTPAEKELSCQLSEKYRSDAWNLKRKKGSKSARFE